MDVGAWLRNLGLGQYETAFRKNEIDAQVLADLTDADLEKLGVLMGHRKRLLRAISLSGANLERGMGQQAVGIEPRPHDAERRQLIVMFCDLVGSTALSTRLDPEDMRAVIGSYHGVVAKAIQDRKGFVAKYMGDGVLAYFGYPRAHEDDAERAVQAGLAIVEAAPRLEDTLGDTLHVRVGIATGIVVVGDLIGSGESRERGVVGDTPNLAARLQGIAKPDSVVIAEATRRLVGDLFELEDLGAQQLKGIAGTMRAYKVLQSRSVESRFEAMHGGTLTPLVGRDVEIELLLRRWARAKAGEGQVVLLTGEAGIGKSRLTEALTERIATEPHVRLRYFCSPQRVDSALYPIVAQMERAAGLTYDDGREAKLDKLDAVLALTPTPIVHTALFAEMLSLPNDGRYPTLDLVPQQRREATLAALVSQIEMLASRNTVLIVVEDAHWADPTSLEVFTRVADRVRSLRALLIVTFRPEFEPPWAGQAHVTALNLNRLTLREIGAVIDGIVGSEHIAADVRQDIIERTDGIPLFVEEMTKAVLEAETEGEAHRTVSATQKRDAVPASLNASLLARLDRLGPAKEIAQIGAAIGREFFQNLLAAVAERPEAELNSALGSLLAAGLLFRQGLPPHTTYLFKHALVRDVAYGTLLRARRQELHRKIASVLQRDLHELVVGQPEVLARHYAEGAMTVEAIDYYLLASKRATAVFNTMEASAHLRRGMTLLELVPSSDPRKRELYTRLNAAGWWWTS